MNSKTELKTVNKKNRKQNKERKRGDLPDYLAAAAHHRSPSHSPSTGPSRSPPYLFKKI
jgi:hypothetical protein